MHIRELHGPADLNFDEVADILSDALGRNIVYIQSDRQEARHALLDAGMSENLTDLMLEMYDAFESGRLQPLEPRSPSTTTPTTLAEFAREVILPKLAHPVAI